MPLLCPASTRTVAITGTRSDSRVWHSDNRRIRVSYIVPKAWTLYRNDYRTTSTGYVRTAACCNMLSGLR
eukprot:scaffold82549_cov18-Prasinocladus_malaysianus.AAC.1